MSHPFGDLLTQHLHRKHGLSQAKLAAGILQPPSIISEMCQGKRLQGRQARERVVAMIEWLQQQGAVTTLDEANALLNAAGMAPLQQTDATKAILIRPLMPSPGQQEKPPKSASANAQFTMLLSPTTTCLPNSPRLSAGRSRLSNWCSTCKRTACSP